MSSADPGSKGFSPEWNIGYSGGEDFILFPRLGRGEKEDKIVGRKSKREREIQMINTLKSDLEFATIYTVSRVLEEEIVQFLSGQFWKGIFQIFFSLSRVLYHFLSPLPKFITSHLNLLFNTENV